MTSNISKLSDFPRNRANSVTPQLTAVPTSPHHSKLKDRKQQQNTLNNLTVGPKHRRSEVEDDLLNVAKVLTKTGRSDLSRVTGQSSQNLDDPGDDGTHRRHSKRTAANRPVPVIRRNSKPTISSGLSFTGSTTQEQTSRRFGSMSSHRSSKVGGTFRRNKIKNEGPKRQRHAVQLDQLAKLQRMTDFSEEAEHEFLVNMYKLRGTFQDRLSDHQYKSDDKEFNQRARFLSGKTAQLGSYGKGSYGKGKGSYGKGSTMPHETEKLERHSSGGIKQMISDVLRRKTGDLAPGRGKPGSLDNLGANFSNSQRKVINETKNNNSHVVDNSGTVPRSGSKNKNYAFTDETVRVFLPSQMNKWDVFVGFLVVFQVLSLPYILSFNPHLGTNFNYVEFAVDLLFFTDMLAQFNVAFVMSADYEYRSSDNKGGHKHPAIKRQKTTSFSKRLMNGIDNMTVFYETRRAEIAKNYLRSWFLIDFLAVLPLVYQIGNSTIGGEKLFPETDTTSFAGFAKSLRVPRLLRLLKVARVLQTFRANNKLRRFLLYSKYTSLFKLLTMICLILVLAHFVACLWWYISEDVLVDKLGDPGTYTPYAVSLLDGILLMVGENLDYVETDSQRIFAFFLVITGSIFVAFIFGEVSLTVSSFNSNSTRYRQKMTELYEAMDTMALPLTLQSRVLQFYDFIWNKHHSLNGKTAMYNFMNELSPNLAKEIQLTIYKQMLVSVPFLREFTADVIHKLVMCLQSKIYMPGDYILTVGECGTDMFFIEFGKCEVFLDHVHVRTLEKNDHFGEIALIADVRRTATVIASTYIQVVTLERVDFEDCAEEMTYTSRKKVLACILKKYQNSNDVLQQCSAPDFVYEEDDSKLTIADDDNEGDNKSLNGRIPARAGPEDDDEEEEEEVEMQVMEEESMTSTVRGNYSGDYDENSIEMAYIQRFDLIEDTLMLSTQSMTEMDAKINRLVDLTIKLVGAKSQPTVGNDRGKESAVRNPESAKSEGFSRSVEKNILPGQM